MPAPFDFPGHYWDEEKGKFFKIENSGTAPAGASWSREQVSHQRQRERIADAARAKRGHGGRRPTKRAKYSDGADTDADADADAGDGYCVLPSRAATRLTARLPFLGRESSGTCTPSAPSVSTGHCFEPLLRASAAASYTHSLQYKGSVPVLDERFAMDLDYATQFSSRRADTASGVGPFAAALTQPKVLSGTRVTCMYIQPDPGPPGLGIVYTNCAGGSIKGQYIMTDDDEFVSNKWPTRPPYEKYSMWERTRPELLSLPYASTISYHESSRNMIVTALTAGTQDAFLEAFSPHAPSSHPNKRGVVWQMGLTHQRGHGAKVFSGSDIGASVINACVPSPHGFDALCVVATENGLSVVDVHAGKARATFGSGSGLRTTVRLRTPADTGTAGFVASIDFVDSHPSLVVAGGLFATPWLIDLREGMSESGAVWRSFRPFSPMDSEDTVNAAQPAPKKGRSKGKGKGKGKGKANQTDEPATIVWNAAHVRSVNDHHVVVAGVRDTMVLYDLRYLAAARSSPSSSSGSAAEPLLRFANYYNSDRMLGLGFAVDKQLGIVAAAEAHAPYTGLGGGVGLFSLATGERLAAPSLKSTLFHATDTLARFYPSLAAALPTITSSTAPAPTTGAASAPGASDIKLPRIPALSFAELPGEQGPSLFAGLGAYVHKFSARKIFEDVIDDDEDAARVLARSRARQLSADEWHGPDVMPLNAGYY